MSVGKGRGPGLWPCTGYGEGGWANGTVYDLVVSITSFSEDRGQNMYWQCLSVFLFS